MLGHRTISAAMAVANDIIMHLIKKKHCAAMLVDLSNAFDSVDHELLLARLNEGAVNWFENDLADRTKCVYAKESQVKLS
jgi:hypothetical protein